MSHVCQDCIAQEVMHSIEMTAHGECHLCGEDSIMNHQDATEGCTIHHHCYHGVELLMASELVKTEVQFNTSLFYPAPQVVILLHDDYSIKKKDITPPALKTKGRDLTTLHCQILS